MGNGDFVLPWWALGEGRVGEWSALGWVADAGWSMEGGILRVARNDRGVGDGGWEDRGWGRGWAEGPGMTTVGEGGGAAYWEDRGWGERADTGSR